MAYEKCPKCGFMHYATDPCRQVFKATSTGKIVVKSSPTVVVKIIQRTEDSVTWIETPRRRGRPKTIDDMRAYKALKERERRARLKASKA